VTLVVGARFNGPDGVGNGGYSAGRFAALVGADLGGSGAMVTLRRPVPLDRPLATVGDDAGVLSVLAGDALVAEVARTSVEAVPYAEAAAAEATYPGLVEHPFPRCFVCGPARAPGDGMRLFPGRLGDGRTACTWTPTEDPEPALVWAALDCPGGWASDIEGRPMVLGRLTAQVRGLPAAGEPCVVMGRLLGSEVRKTWTATTAYGADGRELGRAHATWIAVP
jgi:hypothetical protein